MVKVNSSPINPLDFTKLGSKNIFSQYKDKLPGGLKLPYIMGSECSGVIVRTSEKN